jgi:hypothetical protein
MGENGENEKLERAGEKAISKSSPEGVVIPPAEEPFLKRRAVRLVACALPLFVIAGWCISNFFQLRGYVSVIGSRIYLGVAVIALLIWCSVFAFNLRKNRLLVGLILFTLLVAAALALDRFSLPHIQRPTPALLPPIPVYFNCQEYGFPIEIAPHSTAYIMPLHPKLKPVTLPFYRGFDEVTNYSNSDLMWPSKKGAIPAPIPSPRGSPGSIITRCEVTNASNATLEEAHIRFLILMEKNSNPGSPQVKFYYTVTITALTPTRPFTFT